MAKGSQAFGSPANYAAALRAVIAEGVPENQIEIVRHHYAAGTRGVSMAELAEFVGYASFGGVNLQYGALARRVGSRLGLTEPPGFWIWVFATWARADHPITGHSRFVMRQEVVKALQLLGFAWAQR